MKLDDLFNAYRAELDTAPAPHLEHLFTEEPATGHRAAWRRWALPLSGLAAAASLAMLFWPTAPATQRRTIEPLAPVAVAQRPVENFVESPAAVSAPAVAVPAVVRVRQSVRRPAAPFIALAEMDMLPAPRTYQIVHISVDEERLVGLGLRQPMNNSGRKVAAQVLLGEDGIARAIRVLGEERD